MKRPLIIAALLSTVFGVLILGVANYHPPRIKADTVLPDTIPASTSVTGPPQILDINGIEWRIEYIHTPIDAVYGGMTDCFTHVITVGLVGDIRNTVIHEAMHASVCIVTTQGFLPYNLYFNSTSEEKHEGFYRFSDFMRELLIRNPGLAEWLGQK